MTVKKELVAVKNGKEIYSFRLTNRNGMCVSIINFGGVITGIHVPDRQGKFENVVLHYDHTEDYFEDMFYIGSMIGRYANRIAGGSFALKNREVKLTLNEPELNNHLHGGFFGFNKKVWHIVPNYAKSDKLTFSCFSPHLEEGYPGNMKVEITYKLTDSNELQICYTAETDKPTIINLTNHSYFNLSGDIQSILNHEICINASAYTPADSCYIPTGEKLAVNNSIYDLRQKTKVAGLASKISTINYCIDEKARPKEVASLYDPSSGRKLQVFTTEPGLQVYYGNFLEEPFSLFAGMAIEPQHFPDSPNHVEFPSTLLLPDKVYKQITVYKFSTM